MGRCMAPTAMFCCVSHDLWDNAEGGKERRQIVVNQLPEQSRAWMHALITGVAAGKF
ncbi:MAG: hypothetical protein BKPUNTRY_002825, partial [Candidatus Fervidibacter sp.]